jgi:uncharacterized membrane protein
MDQANIYNPPTRTGATPAAASLAGKAEMAKSRIAVIDVMRGFIMLIMLFDHVRETIYLHMQVTDPMTVAQTAPELFFTRLAAHFCAPMFVFLTGLSAWLYAHPAAAPRNATGFLIKRGLLLIALELVAVNFAWAGQFPPAVLYLQVIWVIGLAMIFLGLVHRLPLVLLGAVSLAIIFGHNAFAGLSFASGSFAQGAYTVLLERGFLIPEGAVKVKVTYPLLPWIGVILLGYVCGPLYGAATDPARRKQLMLTIGGAALLMLLVLRGFNIYGENAPWVVGQTGIQTVMSFLNFTSIRPRWTSS